MLLKRCCCNLQFVSGQFPLPLSLPMWNKRDYYCFYYTSTAATSSLEGCRRAGVLVGRPVRGEGGGLGLFWVEV